ncbi:ankyrin [Lojkania enalia]|uniref:Ankyrin n=1 Tax=Lojkania enalia TaxID=147567 RepID=A0A9P4K891_9PLEO|nr:ankyrin [Didymosphaeria enalia]
MEAIGLVAVSVQLLVHTLSSARALANLYDDIDNTPSELKYVKNRLGILHNSLKIFQSQLIETDDEDQIVSEIRQRCLKDGQGDQQRLRTRVKFAIINQGVLIKLLDRLQDAENDLKWITQIMNMYAEIYLLYSRNLSLVVTRAIHKHGFPMQSVYTTADTASKSLLPSTDVNEKSSALILNKTNGPTITASSSTIKKPSNFVLSVDSWLRKMGVYCAVDVATDSLNIKKIKLLGGYNLPTWLTSKSFQVCLHLLLDMTNYSISIMPGFIRVLNRIPLESPFMLACQRGDIPMMGQYLRNDSELLHTKTICTGRTPLHLAIEGAHVEAVRYLLENGADVHMGDDERILPIFAAIGFKDKSTAKRLRLSQLAPPTPTWIDLLTLLVQYGASVHETLSGKTLTTVLLWRENYFPQLVTRYFNLLAAENYLEFDSVDDYSCSGLANAIRSGGGACTNIDFLAKLGCNITRILPNGQTALHIAAALASNAAPLRHLYAKYSMIDINRQDQWGWTPLHYAIESPSYRDSYSTCEKVRFLLEMGADLHITGELKCLEILHPSNCFDDPISPFEYSKFLGGDLHQRFLEDIVKARIEIGTGDDDDDEWHDCVERGLYT